MAYAESKSGMGDDFVPGGPAVSVTYAPDGSVAFVDQVHQAGQAIPSLPPGVTAQRLQTMGGRVAVVGGLLALVALGGPVALLARFALGWAWTKSLLIGAGVGAAGAAWWGWRTENAIREIALLNAAPATATVAPAGAPVTAASTAAAAAPAATSPSAPVTGLQTQTGPQLGLETNLEVPTVVVYKGVAITIAPPTPALLLWTAAFTAPGQTTASVASGPDPASTLTAAQAAIDAALASPPAAGFTKPAPVPIMTPHAAVSAVWVPLQPPPAGTPVVVVPKKSTIFPIIYRGVQVSFSVAAGKYTATFKLPQMFAAQSTAPQSSYQAAVNVARATIDAALQSGVTASPF